MEEEIVFSDLEAKMKKNPEIEKILSTADSFDFNVFELSKVSKGQELVYLATHLMAYHNLMFSLNMDTAKFSKFIRKI